MGNQFSPVEGADLLGEAQVASLRLLRNFRIQPRKNAIKIYQFFIVVLRRPSTG
jgi:hypothetical protein